MDELEQALADDFYSCIQDASLWSERSQQAREFHAGLSDIGFCSERLRRMMNEEQPDDTDVTAAFIGTAIGKEVEAAYQAKHPDAILQADVKVKLHGDQGDYELPGHPDIVIPRWQPQAASRDMPMGLVVDGKTTLGLELVRRSGASFAQKVQLHGYALGAFEAGLFHKSVPLEDVWVANVWLDRSAQEKQPHVQLSPFDPEVLAEAGRWLDNVVYAYAHGEEAMKEPPLEMCAVTCGFFVPCRGGAAPTGLITEPSVLAALELYAEGGELETRGKSYKAQAKPALKGFEGSDGKRTLRWLRINEGFVEGYERRAYDRIDVRKIR